MYLQGIETLRAVKWSKSYLWDIIFLGAVDFYKSATYGKPKAPFDTWFPATEVEVLDANIQVFDFSPPMRNLSVPKGSEVQRLSVNFVDDVDCTIQQWMAEWMNEQILNNGAGVSPVTECLRTCIVYRLNNARKPIKGWRYNVFPTGELPWQGRSESAANEYKVDFVVWQEEKILDVSESYAMMARRRQMEMTSDL